jgi:hypothetical protein
MIASSRDTTSAKSANVEVFRNALSQLGYVEGQNLIIEYRSGEGHIERFPELATEMVGLKVDIIVTRGTPAVIAAGPRLRPLSWQQSASHWRLEWSLAWRGQVEMLQV